MTDCRGGKVAFYHQARLSVQGRRHSIRLAEEWCGLIAFDIADQFVAGALSDGRHRRIWLRRSRRWRQL